MTNSMPFRNDPSFYDLVKNSPILADITSYLPQTIDTEIFNGQSSIDQLWSSYRENGYGSFFYALVRLLKPLCCIELGVLEGFSLLTMAAALRDNGRGKIEGIDLFEDYPYRHAKFEIVWARIKKLGLESYADLQRADALEAYKRYDQVDLLHVDISNNGDTYRTIFEQWADKVSSVMLFEGGSKERDDVSWMTQYQKPSIVEALSDLQFLYPRWRISVLKPFPSVTVALNVALDL